MLEKKYDLMYSFRELEKGIEKSLKLLDEDDLKERWRKKRETMLKDKIDVADFLVDFIDGWPNSLDKYGAGDNWAVL